MEIFGTGYSHLLPTTIAKQRHFSEGHTLPTDDRTGGITVQVASVSHEASFLERYAIDRSARYG